MPGTVPINLELPLIHNHLTVHLFICAVKRYLWSTYPVLDVVRSARDVAVNKDRHGSPSYRTCIPAGKTDIR